MTLEDLMIPEWWRMRRDARAFLEQARGLLETAQRDEVEISDESFGDARRAIFYALQDLKLLSVRGAKLVGLNDAGRAVAPAARAEWLVSVIDQHIDGAAEVGQEDAASASASEAPTKPNLDVDAVAMWFKCALWAGGLWELHALNDSQTDPHSDPFGFMALVADNTIGLLRWPSIVLFGLITLITIAFGVADVLNARKRRVDKATKSAERTARTVLDRAQKAVAKVVAAVSMPEPAVKLVASIRGHIASARLTVNGADGATESICVATEAELADLLECYQRATVARAGLPDSADLGDAELLAGLAQIESAILAKRSELAQAALNDLKVQSRFVELKHGNGPLN